MPRGGLPQKLSPPRIVSRYFIAVAEGNENPLSVARKFKPARTVAAAGKNFGDLVVFGIHNCDFIRLEVRHPHFLAVRRDVDPDWLTAPGNHFCRVVCTTNYAQRARVEIRYVNLRLISCHSEH